MSKPENPPAFPIQKQQYSLQGVIYPAEFMPGMTLRDYFAGQAIIGLLSGLGATDQSVKKDVVAYSCYVLADAMLAERNKTDENT